MLSAPALRTLASAKLAWFTFAHTLAPGAVATTHTRQRTDAAGNAYTQLVTRDPRYLVPNGPLVTGERLLTMALANARRVSATPQLWSQVVMTDAGVPELPPLYTSGRELAQKLRLTERTIRRHMQELKACGFITRYQFRGREHAYCVWINPTYVWETPQPVLTDSELASSGPALQNLHGTNCPLKEVLEPLEPLKSAITEVEKLVTARGACETGTPLTGTAGPPSGCAPAPQVPKSGAGAARREQFYHKAQTQAQTALQAEKKRYCLAFWTYAKLLIYKGKSFNPEAERLALRAIWRNVFHDFPTTQTAQKDWFKALERRIELAAAWLQRNPNRWPELPYAEFIEGRGYFEAGNHRGFAGTAQWLAEEQRNKRIRGKGGLERSLDEAVLELAQRQRLDAGQKRVQASKRAKLLDFNRLHSFHFRKLRALGGDEALYRFEARLQAAHLLSLFTPNA